MDFTPEDFRTGRAFAAGFDMDKAIDVLLNKGVEYEIQGNYGQGWECVTTEETWVDAKEQLQTYRDNEPGIRFRIKRMEVKA